MTMVTRNSWVIQHSTPNSEDNPVAEHELVILGENRSKHETQSNEDGSSNEQKACTISVEDLTNDGGEEELE